MDTIWVPIAIALFGNAVAVLVVVLSNRSAIKREDARQEHERQRWAREDALKVGEVQRGYYFAFYRELRAASLAIHDAGYGIGPALEFGWQETAYDALTVLEMFGSPQASSAARAVYSALYAWGSSGEGGYESDLEIAYDEALTCFLARARLDMGIIDQSQT
ncbi:hypothetical protein ACF044_11385 [Microbacterium sp. NPDC016588]